MERLIKRVKMDDQSLFPITLDNARSELDSRADTICAGLNCRLIHYTGQECTVNGFHNKLGAMEKIPIATVATAWSDEHTGQGFILIMHEVLFFGNDLDHSLINPNQIRHNGFQLFDNPYETDPIRQMGIVINENDRIPFQSQGTTIYFNSRFPTDLEMETYPHVVLTCEAPWDPSGIAMPGGLTQDRFVQKVQSLQFHGTNRHHHMYETDCVAYSNFMDTEQLQMESAIKSINVDYTSGAVNIAQLHSTTPPLPIHTRTYFKNLERWYWNRERYPKYYHAERSPTCCPAAIATIPYRPPQPPCPLPRW